MSQADAEVGAVLQRDFAGLEPVVDGVTQRVVGGLKVSVGRLALTRSHAGGAGDISKTYTRVQTAAVLSGDALRFPTFNVIPEGVGPKVADVAMKFMFGGAMPGWVDLSAHPEFSRRYRVHAFDTERTRWLLDDAVLERLAATQGLSISGANGTLILYRDGEEIGSAATEGFLGEAAPIFQAFAAAASRPSALQSRTAETEMELFVKQMPAGFGVKLLPAFSLAEAEAFIRLPPPRAFTPAVARFCDERVPKLYLYLAGGVALAGTMFVLIGGASEQLKGFMLALVGLMPAAGLGGAIWWAIARWNCRRLLREGVAATARLESLTDSGWVGPGGAMVKLEFQFQADGASQRASCRMSTTELDSLKAAVAEKRPAAMLYSAGNPRRALLAHALVMKQGIG